MSRHAILALAATLWLGAASTLRADEFAIDNSHTGVVFRISHMGLSHTYGRFNKIGGGYTLEAGKPEASTFNIAIDAGSIDTNDAKRDEHLRGPDFLNAGEFQTITFKSTKVVPKKVEGGIVLEVTGDLTMHGETRPVTLVLKKLGEGPGPTGNDFRTGFDTQTTLKRSEFGMTKMVGPIGDDVEIMISFEGVRKEGAATSSTTPAKSKRVVVAAAPKRVVVAAKR